MHEFALICKHGFVHRCLWTCIYFSPLHPVDRKGSLTNTKGGSDGFVVMLLVTEGDDSSPPGSMFSSSLSCHLDESGATTDLSSQSKHQNNSLECAA